MKILGLLVAVLTGCMLLYCAGDFPDWADPNSPASLHLSPHYIEKTMEETAVPNMVTAVLADYRGFDTMFETGVIFTAGVTVIILLRRFRRRDESELPADTGSRKGPPDDIIIQTICRFIAPFMQLFALYVLCFGHHSPGGGFQGGVIFGASFILLGVAYDLKTMLRRMGAKVSSLLANTGLLVYSGIGALCILLGANFLDYSILNLILPATGRIMARSHAILGVEIGVFLGVSFSMISIYLDLSSHGQLDEGL